MGGPVPDHSALMAKQESSQPPLSPSYKVTPIYIGIDAGTSGIRTCAINNQGEILASSSRNLPLPLHQDDGGIQQEPVIWQKTLQEVMQQLSREIDFAAVVAIAVDGTSGTVCLLDKSGEPVTTALMYNDARAIQPLKKLKSLAPANSPVHSVSAGLPKILWLAEHGGSSNVSHIAHQADWLTFQFTHRAGHSDVNNCLKTGYDPVNHCWPDWINKLEIPAEWFPVVNQPGEKINTIDKTAAQLYGLPTDVMIVAGTTDSHAAILATGIRNVGDAVTSLGSTLVTKVISKKPVFNSDYGIYSQPFGDNWLVGGASNSGGAVLRKYFTDEKMQALTRLINVDKPSGLDYYPLLNPGERFPINDPGLQPRLSPRPDNEAVFFQAMLEGIAQIEHHAYELLHKLGAPYPSSVRTVGGGAVNEKWIRIRAKFLNVDMLDAKQTEAAYGSALLALQGQQ